jgi:hypothetical protein
MGLLLFVLGTIGVMTAVVRGSDYPEPKHKARREVKRMENGEGRKD